MAMPDEGTATLRSLIEKRDFQGIISFCEATLLKAASRAGLTHEYYAVHCLSLVSLGRFVSARHLSRQRALLPPQPVPAKDALATSVAQAARAGDVVRVHSLLTIIINNNNNNNDLLAPMARATADVLRERTVKQLARAYVRISGAALAATLGISESELPKLHQLGWTQDGDGYLCPPQKNTINNNNNNNDLAGHALVGANGTAIPAPSEQVSMLADQLIRLQTTG